MRKKALLVGIEDYPKDPLNGCANDVIELKALLERNGDAQKTPNFRCKTLISRKKDKDKVTKVRLRRALKKLLLEPAEVALLYFSGHGSEDVIGGYLATQDWQKDDPGIPFPEILGYISQSPVPQIIIILDCCYSGNLVNGQIFGDNRVGVIREGVSILTSCLPSQLSYGGRNGGIFSEILKQGLSGQAADILGRVSIAEIYSQADSLLNEWSQRPMLKAHLSRMAILREVTPEIDLCAIRRLKSYFGSLNYVYPLNPSFEKTREEAIPTNVKILDDMQLYRSLRLVEPHFDPEFKKTLKDPKDANHLYFAAIYSQGCKLTDRGKFFWKLVDIKAL